MNYEIIASSIKQGSRVVVAAMVPAKGDEDAPIIAAAIRHIEAAGGTVVETLLQRRGVSRSRKPGGVRKFRSAMNAATFMGSGKVHELAGLVARLDADAVVFCNPLSGTQLRNIEELVRVPVILFLAIPALYLK